MSKRKIIFISVSIQVILIFLWGFDIINRSFINFLLITSPTWFPFALLYFLKLVEKKLREKVNNKLNSNKNGQKKN